MDPLSGKTDDVEWYCFRQKYYCAWIYLE